MRDKAKIQELEQKLAQALVRISDGVARATGGTCIEIIYTKKQPQ